MPGSCFMPGDGVLLLLLMFAFVIVAQVVPIDADGNVLDFARVLEAGIEPIEQICERCGLAQQVARVLDTAPQNKEQAAAPFLREFDDIANTFPGTGLLATNQVFLILS